MPSPAEPVEAQPAVSKGDTRSKAPTRNRIEPRPLPPKPEGVEPIVIIGFGVRFAVYPPMQAARLGGMIPGAGPDTIVVSQWDTSQPDAGKMGVGGLHNTTIVPQGASGKALIPGTRETTRGLVHTMTMGEGGTEIRIPDGLTELGGIGMLTPGPATEEWAVEVDGKPVVWPEHTMVHSADPASGALHSYLKIPEKPWGPWPTD